MDVTADRDELLPRLNDYEVFEENLERKQSDKDAILKAMTASMKQLKKS